MRKTRLFSILALLLMAVTGAWAQKDTPLTLKAKTAGTIVVTTFRIIIMPWPMPKPVPL